MTALGVVSRPEEVEEEAVARSTRTEKASDGGKVTTTTTVTTHKTKGKMIHCYLWMITDQIINNPVI